VVKPRLLLDVNIWIALLDEAHVHNATVRHFFTQSKLRIATCAFTENGALRILNLPNYAQRTPPRFAAVRDAIERVCKDFDHEYWPCDISFRDPKVLDPNLLSGHNQITDAYLLALCVRHEGALLSLDQRIALNSVPGATAKHLMIL
jgi:uncharacterized protein